MTVPAKMIFPSTINLLEMENSVLSSSLFLSSPEAVSKLKKLVSKFKFLPVTLEIKKMGMTSSDEVILYIRDRLPRTRPHAPFLSQCTVFYLGISFSAPP